MSWHLKTCASIPRHGIASSLLLPSTTDRRLVSHFLSMLSRGHGGYIMINEINDARILAMARAPFHR